MKPGVIYFSVKLPGARNALREQEYKGKKALQQLEV